MIHGPTVSHQSVYSTRNDEFLDDVNERYYRWVRAVVDRVSASYVVPFNDRNSALPKTWKKPGKSSMIFTRPSAKNLSWPMDRSFKPDTGNFPGMIALSLWIGAYLSAVPAENAPGLRYPVGSRNGSGSFSRPGGRVP